MSLRKLHYRHKDQTTQIKMHCLRANPSNASLYNIIVLQKNKQHSVWQTVSLFSPLEETNNVGRNLLTQNYMGKN